MSWSRIGWVSHASKEAIVAPDLIRGLRIIAMSPFDPRLTFRFPIKNVIVPHNLNHDLFSEIEFN